MRYPTAESRVGVAKLAGQYDVFLLDQWGVLHGGQAGFPHAAEAVRFLKGRGKSVVVITNSGKSAETNADRLEQRGYSREWFDAIVTSGDMATNAINRDYAESSICWIDHIFDPHIANRLPAHTVVSRMEDADLIFLSGWDTSIMDWRNYADSFAIAIEHNIPMICGNPDVTGFERGKLAVCPGWIANKFREMGGSVTYFGKPDPAAFATGISGKAVFVGDSFETDIRGASRAGIDSVLISSGIHGTLFAEQGIEAAVESLSLEFSSGEILPTYIMQSFEV